MIRFTSNLAFATVITAVARSAYSAAYPAPVLLQDGAQATISELTAKSDTNSCELTYPAAAYV